jgi:hypothetical protein
VTASVATAGPAAVAESGVPAGIGMSGMVVVWLLPAGAARVEAPAAHAVTPMAATQSRAAARREGLEKKDIGW